MANKSNLTKNLENPRSFEYKFLKDLLRRELGKHNVQEIIANNIDGTNKYLDKIEYNDVISQLSEYSGNSIIIQSDLYLRPGERFKITKANFKRLLQGESDLSKSSMISNIKNRVSNPEDFYSAVPVIKNNLITRLSYLYQSQKKDNAMRAHLNRVLSFKYKLKNVDDEIKEFVEKQHKIANNELKQINSSDTLTLDMVMDDKKLRDVLATHPFTNLYVYNSLNSAKSAIMKLLNPSPDELGKFIAKHRQFKASKHILKHLVQKTNDHNDSSIGLDPTNMDNQALMVSLAHHLSQYPSLVTEALYNDSESLIELIKDNTKVNDLVKTNQNKFVLILN